MGELVERRANLEDQLAEIRENLDELIAKQREIQHQIMEKQKDLDEHINKLHEVQHKINIITGGEEDPWLWEQWRY